MSMGIGLVTNSIIRGVGVRGGDTYELVAGELPDTGARKDETTAQKPEGVAVPGDPTGGGGELAAVDSGEVGDISDLIAQDVIARLNKERQAAGMRALGINPYLTSQAEYWAQHMTEAGYNHSPQERLQELLTDGGLGSVGENLHAPEVQCAAAISCQAPNAQPTSGVLHVDWMRSGTHRANMMAVEWDEVGVGIVCDDNGRMWSVILFGAPGGVNVPSGREVAYQQPAVGGNDGVMCNGKLRGDNPAWSHTSIS
jgi:uncharacterized protein YkwD